MGLNTTHDAWQGPTPSFTSGGRLSRGPLGPDDYGVFATRRFIDGLRRAVEEGEPVLFG